MVAELCAAHMSQEIIAHHIIGRLDQTEILEARRRVKGFINNEGLGCMDDAYDLPDRLCEKLMEGGERIAFDNWLTKSLASAYNNDVENINKLQIKRFTVIVQKLNSELSQLQSELPDRAIEELHNFQGVLIGKSKDVPGKSRRQFRQTFHRGAS